MSIKPKLVASELVSSFQGVAFEFKASNMNSGFTPHESEELMRIIRLYRAIGLLDMPKFIHSSDKAEQKCSGILVPRTSDNRNAFYLIKKADPKAASEYTLVMRGFEETGKMSERVETINFPRIVTDLRAFLFEQSPASPHLSLVWNG